MSILTPGTLCITVGGSGENAGRIVTVLSYCGPLAFAAIKEGYDIRTASGRPFASVRKYSPTGSYLVRDVYCECAADRRRLRPLYDPNVDAEALTTDFIMQKPLAPKAPAECRQTLSAEGSAAGLHSTPCPACV